MGNDGGSIPKRRELVKEAVRAQTASEVKESQQEQHGHQWSTCAVSQAPLRAPVVSDCMGTLYNKDAVLEFLLPSEDAASKADAAKAVGGRVASLRDIVEVKFKEEAGSRGPAWVCPITNKQLGPGVKAAYIVPCGHAFSETALKEVAQLVCLECNAPYESSNIITILPVKSADRARLQERADTLKEKGLSHSLKKDKSKRKRKNAEVEAEVATGPERANGKENGANGTEHRTTSGAKNGTAASGAPAAPRINNAATASLTARVLAEEEARTKRRKQDATSIVKELFSSSNPARKRTDGDFMTRGFSIPSKR